MRFSVALGLCWTLAIHVKIFNVGRFFSLMNLPTFLRSRSLRFFSFSSSPSARPARNRSSSRVLRSAKNVPMEMAFDRKNGETPKQKNGEK